jgi:hypothetical protein
MDARAKLGIVLTLIWTLGAVHSRADQSPTSAEPAQITAQRFVTRADEPLITYRGFRRLEAFNDRLNLYGWIEVATELTADGFHYQVLREGGSDSVRAKVLLPVLQNESRLFATNDPSRAAVTGQNYDICGAERAEPGIVKLMARPKRRDVSLVEGALFVRDEDADLIRVEGRLAKNPSFWTKRVDVVRKYGRVAGVRVPLRLDSVAQMRLVGTATLSMIYEYEMVNGVAVAASDTGGGRR